MNIKEDMERAKAAYKGKITKCPTGATTKVPFIYGRDLSAHFASEREKKKTV